MVIKEKAVCLRRQGYSFREISLALGVSKSTASLWARHEPLDEEAKRRLGSLGERGRQRSAETNKLRRQKLWQEISEACPVLRNKSYSQDDYKAFLALLYWAEGAKDNNSFNFINSDPAMIRVYLYLLRRAFPIDESRFRIWLHLHEYHDREEMIAFWSKVTAISKNLFSVYNKPHTGINKKPGYKGCLALKYRDTRILKELFIIIKRFRKFS